MGGGDIATGQVASSVCRRRKEHRRRGVKLVLPRKKAKATGSMSWNSSTRFQAEQFSCRVSSMRKSRVDRLDFQLKSEGAKKFRIEIIRAVLDGSRLAMKAAFDFRPTSGMLSKWPCSSAEFLDPHSRREPLGKLPRVVRRRNASPPGL